VAARDPGVARAAARFAALTRWSRAADPTAATAPARAAFLAKFEREVDPAGDLSPEERRRRALIARKAYYAHLALGRAQTAANKNAAKVPTSAAFSDVEGDSGALQLA